MNHHENSLPSPEHAPTERSIAGKRCLYIWTAALLLGVLFAQAMASIPRLSITFDEDLHISTGYSVLRTGGLQLVEDHPPLIGLWMSWPLLLSPDIPDPREMPTWAQSDRRLFVRNEIWWNLPIDSWVVPPRIPISWLALLMGAFLFRWASELFGPRAGILALAFFVFDPNILAHGTLATLDLGVTCCIFIAMYGVQRYLRNPNWMNAIIGGILLGLALAAKISAFILLPISVGLIVLWGLKHWRQQPISQSAMGLIAYLGVAFLSLWAAHLFDFGPPPGLDVSLPAPTYFNSFLRVGRHVSRGNPAYLMGQTYVGGRWQYFPIAFALKTPLPTLVLAGAALGKLLLAGWRSTQERWRALVMASMPIIYFLISIANRINIGYRHLLPILPFLYLLIAHLAAPILNSKGVGGVGSHNRSRITSYASRVIVFAFLLWQMIGTLGVWPFHLTFFNEIAGGPQRGYRYLADSNVDWGQGLKAVRNYLEANPQPNVRLSSFTFFIRPELYGVEAEPLPPLAQAPAVLPTRFNPTPGTYVISASTLRGLQLVDREMYNWFWHREPDDMIANALLVYHVSKREPKPSWLAQCTIPITPLSPQAVIEGFGRTDLRLLAFDCTQSWPYPGGGDSAGWYALHRDIATAEDIFVQQQLTAARLSFEKKTSGVIPSVTVFEWNPLEIPPPQREKTLRIGPAEWPPTQTIAEGTIVSVPVTLEGPLVFLGHDIITAENMVTLLTYWQVVEPVGRPFSLMGHLVGIDGQHVSVGDGLGIPWNQLQPGDVFIQRHSLPIPIEMSDTSFWLQTGAYWLDTMDRWRVDGEQEADALFLEMPSAESED